MSSVTWDMQKLGPVAKYTIRHRKPPSPTWRSFLETTPLLPISLRSTEHGARVKDLVSIDFFTVPTATFRVLSVLLVLSHDRRRVLHFDVTSSPSAEWTAQRIVQAFPEDTAPCYLLRDRDGIYGACFRHRVHNLGIEQVSTAPRSPWQSPYVERLVGSVRRDCRDQVIVPNEQHLRRILRRYFEHHNEDRPHRALDADAPVSRAAQVPGSGRVVALSRIGGLHHRYARAA